MATAAITLMMTMTVLTSCTSDNDDNPVVVTDDKPFTYDSEIDNTVRPGDNFYRYALGKWLDSDDPAPSLFQQIRENNQALLVKTLTTGNDPLLVRLRSLVDDAMSDDSRSAALLKERLQMLEQIETADQLYDAFAKLHQLGYSPLARLAPYVSNSTGKNIGCPRKCYPTARHCVTLTILKSALPKSARMPRRWKRWRCRFSL